MGYSAAAYLYFGFDVQLDEEGQVPLTLRGDDWEEEYAARCGIADVSGLFKDDGSYAYPEGTPERLKASRTWNEYHEKKRLLLEPLLIDIRTHGYGDAEYTFYVCVKRNHQCATDGESEVISTVDSMEPTSEEIAELISFCNVMDIPVRELGWRLASYWG